MTNRSNLIELAAKTGASITEREGRISRITWNGQTYGDGCLFDLISFAEKARKA